MTSVIIAGSPWSTWWCICHRGLKFAQDQKQTMGDFQNVGIEGGGVIWRLGLVSWPPFFLQGYARDYTRFDNFQLVKIPFVTDMLRLPVCMQVDLFVLANMIYCRSGKMNVLAVIMRCDQGLGQRIYSVYLLSLILGEGFQCVLQFSPLCQFPRPASLLGFKFQG